MGTLERIKNHKLRRGCDGRTVDCWRRRREVNFFLLTHQIDCWEIWDRWQCQQNMWNKVLPATSFNCRRRRHHHKKGANLPSTTVRAHENGSSKDNGRITAEEKANSKLTKKKLTFTLTSPQASVIFYWLHNPLLHIDISDRNKYLRYHYYESNIDVSIGPTQLNRTAMATAAEAEVDGKELERLESLMTWQPRVYEP